jgi:hypothetical protein
MMGLLGRGDPDTGSRGELFALAADCRDQLPRRDQTLVEAVNERLRL